MRNALQIGEPLRLRERLENTSERMLYLDTLGPKRLLQDKQAFAEIKAPGFERFVRVVAGENAFIVYPSKKAIPPGERCVFPIALFGDYAAPERLVFDTAGVYEIRLAWNAYWAESEVWKRVAITSEPIRVTVHAPEGRDASAYELWHEGFADAEASLKNAGLPQTPLDALRANYSDTPYGQFALYFQHDQWALMLAHDLAELAPQGLDQARADLEYLASESAGFPFRDEPMLDLAEAYAEEGDADAARQMYEAVIAAFPQTPSSEIAAGGGRRAWVDVRRARFEIVPNEPAAP